MRIIPQPDGSRAIKWKYRGQTFGLAYKPHGGLFGERLRRMRAALWMSVQRTQEILRER